jgi:hypothetical protein
MPADPEKWGRVNAHIGLTKEGRVILINEPEDFIWHAQGLSKTTIGIEIEGNYPGIIGKENTLWKPGGGPDILTDETWEGAAFIYGYLKEWFDTRGIKWQHIFAHRQSYKNRTADPGQEIWQKIAMPWMVMSGATDGGELFKIGTGKPIPSQWDIKYNNSYWG